MPGARKHPKPHAKDFGAPEAALPAHFLFNHDIRPKIAEEIGDSLKGMEKNIAVMKKCTEAWKVLPDAEKAPYVEKAKAAKVKYDEEMKVWSQTENYKKWKDAEAAFKEHTAGKNALKAVKEAGQPVRPPTIYMMVQDEVREARRKEGLPLGVTEMTPAVKAAYDGLSEERRAELQAVVNQKKEEYDAAMIEFKKTDAYKAFEDAKSKAKKGTADMLLKQLKEKGMPTKPMNAYMFYQADLRAERTARGEPIDVKSIAPAAKEGYAALSEEKKKEYTDKADVATAKYEREMKEFRKTPEWKEYNKQAKRATKKRASTGSVGGGDSPAKKKQKTKESSTSAQNADEDVEDEEEDIVDEAPEEVGIEA